MPRRTLVTGGAGFIGSHVADAFLAEGHEVWVVDDLSTGFRHNVPARATFVQADIRDAEALHRVFAEARPDLVSHHAAQVDVRKSLVDPNFDAASNIIGSLNVIAAARRVGVQKIIYASTGGAVYGEPEHLPADESHRVRPESAYGISKHTVEHYLELYRLLEGLRATILRYPNVYGPRQNPHGEAGVIAIFCDLLLAGKTPTIYGDGEQLRDYVFVGDIVRANLLAQERADGEIVNLGSGVGTSVNQLFRKLAPLTGFAGTPRYAEARAGEVKKIYLDAQKAARLLDWRCSVDLDRGLTETVAWHKAQL